LGSTPPQSEVPDLPLSLLPVGAGHCAKGHWALWGWGHAALPSRREARNCRRGAGELSSLLNPETLRFVGDSKPVGAHLHNRVPQGSLCPGAHLTPRAAEHGCSGAGVQDCTLFLGLTERQEGPLCWVHGVPSGLGSSPHRNFSETRLSTRAFAFESYSLSIGIFIPYPDISV